MPIDCDTRYKVFWEKDSGFSANLSGAPVQQQIVLSKYGGEAEFTIAGEVFKE